MHHPRREGVDELTSHLGVYKTALDYANSISGNANWRDRVWLRA